MSYLNIVDIRRAVKEEKYIVKTHARQRMGQRKVTDAQIFSIIMEGRIIEEHNTAKPFPKCLILGYVKSGWPLYISCAFDPDLFINLRWNLPDPLQTRNYDNVLVYFVCSKTTEWEADKSNKSQLITCLFVIRPELFG